MKSDIARHDPLIFEDFLNQMVEALDITTDRRPKGRPRKRES